MRVSLILALFVLSMTLYGQNKSSGRMEEKVKPVRIDLSEACDKDKTYWVVQELPEYVGGNKKLITDLNELLALDNDVSGKCYVSFLINCKGKASGFTVVSGENNNGVDKKIIESLERLQNWIPGKYNSQDIDCTYTLKLKLKSGKIMLET